MLLQPVQEVQDVEMDTTSTTEDSGNARSGAGRERRAPRHNPEEGY